MYQDEIQVQNRIDKSLEKFKKEYGLIKIKVDKPKESVLKWTKEFPTEEGFYWYKNKHGTYSVITVTYSVMKYSNYPGEWYGPIEPPEYP
jgi:hypothetical protein